MRRRRTVPLASALAGLGFVSTAQAIESVGSAVSRDYTAWSDAIARRMAADNDAMFADEGAGTTIEVDADGNPIRVLGRSWTPTAALPALDSVWKFLRDNRSAVFGVAIGLGAVALIRRLNR